MLDPNLLRHHLKETAERLKKRGFVLDIHAFEQLESQRKTLQIQTQALQNERNSISKQIGQAKAKKESTENLLTKASQLADQLKQNEAALENLQQQLQKIYLEIPNVLHESVPTGNGEAENQEIRRVGTPKKFDFPIKDHVEIGERLQQMDFVAAAKISAARFVVLYDDLARLQRALIHFMLDVHTKEHGYHEVYVPYLVNQASLYGTGQLPKFAHDQFNIMGETPFSLIPTAEVPLTNIFRDTILEAKELPIKLVAHTPCFRSEAGSYGKDTRGMIRQHQFEKVELVQIVSSEKSYEILEELTHHAEIILQKLALPYRIVALCGGDLGFSAAKTYDLEVWLPGQQRYREISSCSNFEAFQARRLSARWRNPATGKPELVHTLNGSGLAVGRTLVAILENYQDREGNVHIPKVLIPYLDGVQMIYSGQCKNFDCDNQRESG